MSFPVYEKQAELKAAQEAVTKASRKYERSRTSETLDAAYTALMNAQDAYYRLERHANEWGNMRQRGQLAVVDSARNPVLVGGTALYVDGRMNDRAYWSIWAVTEGRGTNLWGYITPYWLAGRWAARAWSPDWTPVQAGDFRVVVRALHAWIVEHGGPVRQARI